MLPGDHLPVDVTEEESSPTQGKYSRSDLKKDVKSSLFFFLSTCFQASADKRVNILCCYSLSVKFSIFIPTILEVFSVSPENFTLCRVVKTLKHNENIKGHEKFPLLFIYVRVRSSLGQAHTAHIKLQ